MTFYKKYQNRILSVLGILAVSMIVLPCLFLGEGSYVQIHDQVDGEILNYIYQAKYLFRGDVIAEFLNGSAKASMLPPAPLGVLFYCVLPPFAAYVAMHFLGVLVGFLGMYQLCKELSVRQEVAFAVAVLFAYIPFYPTYGLTAWGQPLLVWCFLQLLRRAKKRSALVGLVGIAFYAGFSSLSLIGFVWVLAGVLVTLYWGVIRTEWKTAGRAALGTGVLVGVYLLTNLDLLGALLGKGGFVTHRQEMVLHPTEDLWGKIWELLFTGGAYHPVYSGAIAVVLAVLAFGLLVRRLRSRANAQRGMNAEGELCVTVCGGMTRLWKQIAVLLLWVVICVASAAFWNSGLIVNLRKSIGGMVTYFQADRISWTLPMLWMLLLACVGEVIVSLVQKHTGRIAKIIPILMAVCLFLAEGALIFRDSTLNKNIRLLLLPEYEQVTWEALYMDEVFAEIDSVIGAGKQEYSVASIGIYPAVALYHGYTCADGYSNNYNLEYKHIFREIQAEELSENEAVRSYFDDWGNRLYLVSAEYGFNGMIGKTQNAYFEELRYDTDAMRRLNIKYLFAAAPIGNAAELGLELVREEPFADEESYYEIWLYRLE